MLLGLLRPPPFAQLGVGLASAVLIDATIVRAVLLPATMKLLGDWSWHLQWLPNLEHERSADSAPQQVTASRRHSNCR